MTEQNPKKPDLDLIQRVQKARMMHDNAATPSDVSAVYWIEAKCATENCQSPTPRSGQWVLNTTLEDVDALWETIKKATEAGQLGYKSKVSTASRSGLPGGPRTICVRTYDRADADDVQRVRHALEKLGIKGEWQYENA